MNFSETDKKILLKVVDDSILHGLEHNTLLKIDLNEYSDNLKIKLASFVTLKINNNLRGCIGSLIAHQPLVLDVSNNAYSAAFRDPRFKPLSFKEFKNIQKSISVLTNPEPLLFDSEEDLINKIRPNVDGLILTDGHFKGTFLPQVWEELKDKELFLKHLKMKAGLQPDYWSDTLKVDRYSAIIIK